MKLLKETISNQLNRLVDNNYIFLDLPYYTNIGDTLIWKGTEEFLKTVPYKCLYRAAIETYVSPKISKDTIILLQGGGNFGDIWRRHTEFCLKVLNEFSDNKVVVLPQTVYYESETIMKQDALAMGQHSNLTICARDTVTHKLLSTHFSQNKILLLPDMAFCIPKSFLNKYARTEQNKQLFFKRKDKEFCNFDYGAYMKQTNVEEHEWPSMECNSFNTKLLFNLKRVHNLSKRLGICQRLSGKLVDFFAVKIYMPGLLKIGVGFISQYKYVYTTRLHGAILSILLQKSITFFDNSYGKNSSFYNTWLKNEEKIKFVERKN